MYISHYKRVGGPGQYLKCVLDKVDAPDEVQRSTHNVQDQGEDAWCCYWCQSLILT